MQAQVAVPVESIIQMPEYHLLEAECQTPLKQAHSFFCNYLFSTGILSLSRPKSCGEFLIGHLPIKTIN